MNSTWPKGPTRWVIGRTLYISIPFTWNLPCVAAEISTRSMNWDRVVVGGPATLLMPNYFRGQLHVTVGRDWPGVLRRVNPLAIRTTVGCIRKCGFCGIGRGLIESGGFRELPLESLDGFRDGAIVCDNNFLASSPLHFDRVMDLLELCRDVDFNQGLDHRLLTEHHAERFARLRTPQIRLALDHSQNIGYWLEAYERLRSAGVSRRSMSSYALIGYDSSPDEAWERCEAINQHCRCLPMWFHGLNAVQVNQVTADQAALGWTDKGRIQIMRRFYQARFGGKRVA